MNANATRIRKGMILKYKGEQGLVLSSEHRMPGKGSGYVQTLIRSFANGKTRTLRFDAADKIELIEAQRKEMDFNYSDQNGYYFMDNESYELVELPTKIIGEAKNYLAEDLSVYVLYLEGLPISLELPPSVKLKVKEAPAGIRGDTANNPTKAVTMETGLVIQAPLFVKSGDEIMVDTREAKYLGRA